MNIYDILCYPSDLKVDIQPKRIKHEMAEEEVDEWWQGLRDELREYYYFDLSAIMFRDSRGAFRALPVRPGWG